MLSDDDDDHEVWSFSHHPPSTLQTPTQQFPLSTNTFTTTMAGSSNNSRKKTDKTTATTTPSSNKPPASKNGKVVLEEEISRAEAAIERNHAAIVELHQQWRTQLLRMSYLVIVVTLHIAQGPSSACIKDIKQWNKLQTEEQRTTTIPGSEAVKLILHDSVVELMSIICAAFLLRCLQLPTGNDFSSVPYRLSCAVLPMIISLHFQRKAQAAVSTPTSCVEASSVYDITMVGSWESEPVPRHFPVILVFHTIVSISLWFMQYQAGQHQKNVQMIEKLKVDLVGMKKAKSDKKKR